MGLIIACALDGLLRKASEPATHPPLSSPALLHLHSMFLLLWHLLCHSLFVPFFICANARVPQTLSIAALYRVHLQKVFP